MNKYLLSTRVLGKGSSGRVYLGKGKEDDRLYAVKIINLKHLNREDLVSRVIKQVEIPKLLSGHKNVMSAIESIDTGDRFVVIMDYIKGINLYDNKESFNGLALLDLMYELADGLEFIHSRGVAHRDIKPENIILKEGIPIYIDYDLSCTPDMDNFPCGQKAVGTPGYVAPEVIKGDFKHLFSADIFSLGILFYFITHGNEPEETEFWYENPKEIVPMDMNLAKTSSREINEIINSMISYDYHDRPKLSKVKAILSDMIKAY